MSAVWTPTKVMFSPSSHARPVAEHPRIASRDYHSEIVAVVEAETSPIRVESQCLLWAESGHKQCGRGPLISAAPLARAILRWPPRQIPEQSHWRRSLRGADRRVGNHEHSVVQQCWRRPGAIMRCKGGRPGHGGKSTTGSASIYIQRIRQMRDS